MLILLDESFNNKAIKGIRKRDPNLEFLRVQDIPEIFQEDDPTVLEWAAQHGFVVFTRDKTTMPDYAYERLRADPPLPMSGVIVFREKLEIGDIIEGVLTIAGASHEGEYENRVDYYPPNLPQE